MHTCNARCADAVVALCVALASLSCTRCCCVYLRSFATSVTDCGDDQSEQRSSIVSVLFTHRDPPRSP